MAKQNVIEQDGVIIEDCSNSIFRVELENVNTTVLCTISGKIRINNIRLMVGDKVKIEMSPYDLTKGRISYRYK